jgi:hypothetical protein
MQGEVKMISKIKLLTENLLIKRPDLAKEWDYELNGDLRPEQILCNSKYKVWWKCDKNHSWDAYIYSRNKGSGCPYCKGLKATKENNITITHPNLLLEWDYEKNKGINPNEFMYGSGKMVWWICSKNPSHSWKTSIRNRTKGCGCSKCNIEFNTSFPEQSIYYYLKQIFPEAKSRYKYKINLNKKVEIDVYIPEINLGIEYDGLRYHKTIKGVIKDENKNFILSDKIHLIRIRENGLPDINNFSSEVFIRKNNTSQSALTEIIILIFKYILLNFNLNEEIKNTIKNIKIDTEKDSLFIYSLIDYNNKENSLLCKNPKLAEEWNYFKNGKLKPNMINCNSNKKVWWICNKGHEWKAQVGSRNKGCGCPKCSGTARHTYKEAKNLLENLGYELLNEDYINVHTNMIFKDKEGYWYYSTLANLIKCQKADKFAKSNPYTLQNIKLWCKINNKPFKLLSDNFKSAISKLKWKCLVNCCGETFETSWNHIYNGKGCGYCNGKQAGLSNCLAIKKPNLLPEWDYSKNVNITPYDITCGSGKKVWWKCKECGHEWETRINHRTNGSGCPICKRKHKNINNLKECVVN